MILESDALETPFEIKASMVEPAVETTPALYVLYLMHKCPERKSTFEIQLSWKRCPWCSRQVPERIKRIFRQREASGASS